MVNTSRLILRSLVAAAVSAASGFAWVTGVDPSAASFPLANRNADIGYTGDFTWSENVMTVPGRNGLGLDLVLGYCSNLGIDQEASWVGLGFNLTAGYITRNVVNVPDEAEPQAPENTDRGAFFNGTEVHQWNDPRTGEVFGNGFIKPQDRFYLVLPGRGGTEIIATGYKQTLDQNEVNDIRFRCANWRPWKIVPTFDYWAGTRYISSFTVTTEDGTIYKFACHVWSQLSVGQILRTRRVAENPYTDLYDSPRPSWQDWHNFPAAPYIWYLTEIRSADYEDTDATSGPSDGDKGNWVKVSYDIYTSNAEPPDPTDTVNGYGYWTRFEMYQQGEIYPIFPFYYRDEYFRQNRTRMHLAAISHVDTPTHFAEFTTAYRGGADGVAWANNATGHKHPKKLTDITLKSKYGNNARVSRVHFTYIADVKGQVPLWDEHPVTANYGDFQGGRLTLDKVERYGVDDEHQLPPYSFQYPDYYGDYRSYYDVPPDERGKWGGYGGAVTGIRLPTGGTMNISYENDSYQYVQDTYLNDPITADDMVRVKTITYKTGFEDGLGIENTLTPMEYRKVEYLYSAGVAIWNVDETPLRYKSSAVFFGKDNYIAYGGVTTKETERFADRGFEDSEQNWVDKERVVATSYITAYDEPDEPEEQPLYINRLTNNDWKRGIVTNVVSTGGEENSVVNTYEPLRMYEFVGSHLVGGVTKYFYIISGWMRPGVVEMTEDGVRRKTVYCHDKPEQPAQPEPPLEAESNTCNGLPIQIEEYRPARDAFDVANTAKAGVGGAAETASALAGGVAAAIANAVTGDEAAANETVSPRTGIFEGTWDEIKNTLLGDEKIRTTFIEYAYEKDGAPYEDMRFAGKHMMSQVYAKAVTNADFDLLSKTEIHYADVDPGDGKRIYPSSSWVWLDRNYDQLINFDTELVTSQYLGYDDWGNLLHVKDPLDRESYTEYADTYTHSLPTKFTNALGQETTVNYDAVKSVVTKATDANGLETEYEYDDFCQLIAIWYPNNPKAANPNQPSVKYNYNWAWLIDPDDPAHQVNWIRTGRLMEDDTYQWTTSYYNGLGELFRTVRHYNDPVLDTGGDPVTGYFEGMYYDVETNTLGLTSRTFVPYYVDDDHSPGNWSHAISVPFPIDTEMTVEEYRPFALTVYELDALAGPRPAAVYEPTYWNDFHYASFPYYAGRPVRRFRYGSEENEDYPAYADEQLRFVEGYDQEGRATKQYYDSIGRHIITLEGAEYNVTYPLTNEGDWGTGTEYVTTTSFVYDDVDRLITNEAANSLETNYTYDTLSRLTAVTDADRGLIKYGYDDAGNLTMFQDPERRAEEELIVYGYDELNRITAEGVYSEGTLLGRAAKKKEGLTFSAGVDVYGTGVDLYDNSRNRKGEKADRGTDADRGAAAKKITGLFTDGDLDVKITYRYDSYPEGEPGGGAQVLSEYPTEYPKGKLTWTEDLVGEKWFYYDNMGRMVATTSDRCYFDHFVLTHEYNYNLGGQLTAEKYPSGTNVSYRYDAIGRLTHIPGVYGSEGGPAGLASVAPGPSGAPTPAAPRRFDLRSRILPSLKARRLAVSRRPQNNVDYLTAGVNPLLDEGGNDGFEYDDRGRLHTIRPDNGCATTINYDEGGWGERQVIRSISFNLIGANPDVVYDYAYDASRNVTEITDNLAGGEYDRKRTYQYDTLNRLTDYSVDWDTGALGAKNPFAKAIAAINGAGVTSRGEVPDPPPYQFYTMGQVHYDYDDVGNRTCEVHDTTESHYSTYYEGTDQLQTDGFGDVFTYNANGAVATKETAVYDVYDYTYDYAGRLVGITKEQTLAAGGSPTVGAGGPAAGESGPTVGAGPSPGVVTPAYPTVSPPAPTVGAPAGPPTNATPSDPTVSPDEPPAGLEPAGPAFVSDEEEWEFVYDGAGAKIMKINDTSASKYIYDATGRVVMEYANDIRKSSANVVKNPGLEIYSAEPWAPPEGYLAAPTVLVATGAETVPAVESPTPTTEDVGDFGYWEEDAGETPEGSIVADAETPLEGRLAVMMSRAEAGTQDLRLKQTITVKNAPPRTYELRYFAKAGPTLSGRAYVRLTTQEGGPGGILGAAAGGAEPAAAAANLYSPDVEGEEWKEYRVIFACEEPLLGVQLVLDKDATGAVYFDRVSVEEYANDVVNASFEDQGQFYPDVFDDWTEVAEGGTIAVGDGILTADSAKVTRTGGSSLYTGLYQAITVTEGRTYEVAATVKAEDLDGAEVFAELETAEEYQFEFVRVDADTDGWARFVGHYSAAADGDLTLRLGMDGDGTGVAYFEDVGMKELPAVCDNGDFETYTVGPLGAEYVAWEAELNGGEVGVDTEAPRMNAAAAVLARSEAAARVLAAGEAVKVERGRGVVTSDPLGNTLLRQRIACLPHTEYEVTIFEKHDISALEDYYGAFAVVGNITGAAGIPGVGNVYTGDFVEVFNVGVGAATWSAHTVRFTSGEDWFEVLLGVGAAAEGAAAFDGILIRDLTTRRYEYIYGLGRRLAKVEYESVVPEGQMYYDHYDLVGSPVMLTDIDGADVWRGDYAPFGGMLEAQPVNWGNPYMYLGNEDDGGLMDFGARFYDPQIGRFYAPDPIKNVATANVVNPYVYCSNNPLRYTDKFGLMRAAPEGPAGDGGGSLGGTGGGNNWTTTERIYENGIEYRQERTGRQTGWAQWPAPTEAQAGAFDAMMNAAWGGLKSGLSSAYSAIAGAFNQVFSSAKAVDPVLFLYGGDVAREMDVESQGGKPGTTDRCKEILTNKCKEMGIDVTEFGEFATGVPESFGKCITNTKTVMAEGKFNQIIVYEHGDEDTQEVGGISRAFIMEEASKYLIPGGKLTIVACDLYVERWERIAGKFGIQIECVPGRGQDLFNYQVQDFINHLK